MRKLVKRQWFTVAMVLALVLAWGFSEIEAIQGLVIPSIVVSIGIGIIFFLQGCGFSKTESPRLKESIKLLLFVLVWNFILSPLLMLTLLWVLDLNDSSAFILGFLLLSILPSTIASAIALTVASGGRGTNAIIASVFSNLLAVWIVPIFAVVYFALEQQIQVPLLSLFKRLAFMILIPFMVGLFWQRNQGSSENNTLSEGAVRLLTQLILLGIIFVGFVESFRLGAFQTLSSSAFAELLAVCSGLLLLMSFLVWVSAGWFKFLPSDKVAAFYCASQKSLATGLPLIGSILFAAGIEGQMAVITLPILCYHPMQIFLGGILSQSLAKSCVG